MQNLKFSLRSFNPLDLFFKSMSNDIGIDLGTANTLVWVKGKGIVIREPSVVARHKKTKQVIAIGTEAWKMVGKTPASIVTVRPLTAGVIADFDATQAMIAYYIKEIQRIHPMMPMSLVRPRVAIGIPSSVTQVERRAVWEAALAAGAREAFLIEEPMAAAIGADVSVFQPTGVMMVDIGGGTTEIAIISLGGIVINHSLKVAGDDMDNAIVHYMRLRHGLLIGERTAEDLKCRIDSVYVSARPKKKNKEDEEEKADKVSIVRGRNIETGLPHSIRISEGEIREALAPVLTQITNAIADIAEEAPPELMTDILEHGILLTGGGSNLRGLDKMIVEKTRVPVILVEDPLTTVVRGTAKVLENPELLHRVKVTGGLK